MPRITSEQAGSANACAFLDMIAVSEIGQQQLQLTDAGYNVLVGSTSGNLNLFNSYADHPRVLNRALNSTAAGRYQILSRYWDHYKAQLHLPDFGPVSQDKYALQQIKEQRALDDVHAGRFDLALAKVSNIWASLPGAGYGQHENSRDHLLAAYQIAGGTVA